MKIEPASKTAICQRCKRGSGRGREDAINPMRVLDQNNSGGETIFIWCTPCLRALFIAMMDCMDK